MLKAIQQNRNTVWKIQDTIGIEKTVASKAKINSCSYARWVNRLWKSRVKELSNWQYDYKAWMPSVWQRLAHCEGGTRPPQDPNWQHNSGTYQGALGFYYGTWDRFKNPGYPSEAYLATPWQQYQTALNVYNYKNFRFSGWGCYGNPWVKYG